jgi:hypothetical protein
MVARHFKAKHLKFKGISVRARSAYCKAIGTFFEYLASEGLELPDNLEEADTVVSEYINVMWSEGESYGYAGHLLSGLGRFIPILRKNLPTARQYYGNWNAGVLRRQARPFTVRIIRGLVGLCVSIDRLDLAWCIYAGFLCLLRTAEVVQLRAGNVVLFDTRQCGVLMLTTLSHPDVKSSVVRKSPSMIRYSCD